MSRLRPLQILFVGICLGGLGCGDTPRDQYFGTEAGADFDAPPRFEGDGGDAGDAVGSTEADDAADAGVADALTDGEDGG